MTFSPNGETLASGDDNGTIRFWDVATGQLLKTIDTEADTIDAVVYSPDGKTLASTSNNGDAGIGFWDVATGQLLKTITAEAGAYSVVYSPDGSTLASGGLGEVSVWDAATGERLKTFTGHIEDPVYSVAYSPDGWTLVSGCRDSTIILWDFNKMKMLNLLLIILPLISGLCLSLNAFAQANALWSLPTGATNRIGKGRVNAIMYFPDGTKLAVASTIGIWVYDVQTGEPLDLLTGHTGPVNSIAFSPDGATFATASDDNTAGVWGYQHR